MWGLLPSSGCDTNILKLIPEQFTYVNRNIHTALIELHQNKF